MMKNWDYMNREREVEYHLKDHIFQNMTCEVDKCALGPHVSNTTMSFSNPSVMVQRIHPIQILQHIKLVFVSPSTFDLDAQYSHQE